MMNTQDPFDTLRKAPTPAPRPAARDAALNAAMAAFDAENEKFTKPQTATQGTAVPGRLMRIVTKLWSETMHANWRYAGPAIAGVLIVPVAAVLTLQLMNSATYQDVASLGRQESADGPGGQVEMRKQESKDAGRLAAQPAADAPARSESDTVLAESAENEAAVDEVAPASPVLAAKPRPADAKAKRETLARQAQQGVMADKAGGDAATYLPAPPVAEPVPEQLENRDRYEKFDTSAVKSVATDPVSTFAVDVDTASYSSTRRMLMQGVLPDPETVRVEEMINYFSYDWPAPESRETPFRSTVTVTPTPWNANTKLMHVGIKGYAIPATEKPRANLVFLIDVSGSMNQPDKLPLLKNAFRMLVNQLNPADTVSIVPYAGNAGTVLEPTVAKERGKILDAIDRLEPGGSTAGAAGIEEAYRLAESAFIDGGVNRVMLATDGDFNVGPSSDAELKAMIEKKREKGVFLSVFGFGEGNLNDQLMQTLAQNGNGVAAYIDTLSEAQKVLVQEASANLFTIAKDVKIQVEFNPATIAEYRLIGYEPRALKREVFNNDRIDAGDIGSGHTVTAIYEVTPVGSPAILNEPLRYGEGQGGQATQLPAKPGEQPAGGETTGETKAQFDMREYAYVKIRYKQPEASTSTLIATPVAPQDEVDGLATASDDVRFSTAVAAFGQKLRGTDAVRDYRWDEIQRLAAASRGADPFGYRAEFLRLVGLAQSLQR